VRRCLKPELRAEAMKRDEGTIRAVFWKDGKPVASMYAMHSQAFAELFQLLNKTWRVNGI